MRIVPTPRPRPSASELHGDRDEVSGIISLLQQTHVPRLMPLIVEAQDRYALIFLRLYFHQKDAHKVPIPMMTDLVGELTGWKAREHGTAIAAFVRYLEDLVHRSKARRVGIEGDIHKLHDCLTKLVNARNTDLGRQEVLSAPRYDSVPTSSASRIPGAMRRVEPAQPNESDTEHDVTSEPDILAADTEFDALAQQVNDLATHIRMMKVGYAPRNELKRLRGVVDDARYDRNHHKTEIADALIEIIDMLVSQLDYQGYQGERSYGLGESATSSEASSGHPSNERASRNQDGGVVKDEGASVQHVVAGDSGNTTQFVHLVQENMYNNLLTVLLEQCEIERIDVVPGMKFDVAIMRRGSRKVTQKPDDVDRVASVELWGFRYVGKHPSIKRRAVVEVYELAPE